MKTLLTIALYGMLAVSAHAVPIVQYLNGTFSYAGAFTEGESFTTPGGGPWNSISFNFYSNIPATTPAAQGTAFLLSMAYAGTPAALSNATPGFIASSISNAGGIYTFNSSVTLQPNTQYWIFSNTAFGISGSTTAGTAAQSLYTSNGGAFASNGLQVANFTLNGALATPEPTTALLLGAGMLALVLQRKTSRRNAP
jgi:hypothetical protein